MISKKVFLRDIKSNKEFYIVKKSYNLCALNDQKWYLLGSKDLFDECTYVLAQLDKIRAGNHLHSETGEKLYSVLMADYR